MVHIVLIASVTLAETADFVFAGLRDGRELARTGVVDLKAEYAYRQSGSHTKSIVVEQANVAFDLSKNALRIDRKIRRRNTTKKTQYARNSDYSAVRIGEDRVVTKFLPDMEIEVQDAMPLDIRIVGLATHPEWQKGLTYERLCEFLEEHTLTVESADDLPGVEILRWTYKIDSLTTARRSVWVDSTKNFAPIRLVLEVTVAIEGREPFTYTETSSDIEWASVKNVWVPTSWKSTTHKGQSEATIDLSWKSVNEPVAAEVFSTGGMDLPAWTRVVDSRLGIPVEEVASGD